jgi:hypothetical protein
LLGEYRYKISFIIIVLLLIVVSGCGSKVTTAPDASLSEEQLKKSSIIQTASEESILVGDVFWGIDKAKLRTQSGKRMTAKELQVGDLIILETTGIVQTSFPGRGEATKVTVYDDPRSKEISEGIRYILDHQPMGDIIAPSIHSINNDQLVLHFFEWTTNGKKYEASFNLKTKELKVIEIVNEEVEKRKKEQAKMMENRRDAMYSGYITKILPNGVRINRIDFTFDKDIYYKNQNGGKLTRDDFEVGTFVTAYYSGRYDDKTFPFKAPLYGLERLTNEEDPAIMEWVRSLTEGGQFIEPVIMDFWLEKDNIYTLKIIDIKKTKKYLYIVRYDRKTGTHTTEEIPNK